MVGIGNKEKKIEDVEKEKEEAKYEALFGMVRGKVRVSGRFQREAALSRVCVGAADEGT